VTEVRELSGHELMLMIGWPKEEINKIMKYTSSSLVTFAGAAFSGFAIVPVVTAAIYAAGRAGVTSDPDLELSQPSQPKTASQSTRTTEGPVPAASSGAAADAVVPEPASSGPSGSDSSDDSSDSSDSD
jgi:hypothetical protein